MGMFSILPESLQTLETWLTRTFLLLGFMTIGPWAILIIYDFVLYVFRTILHEIPIIGGRARGQTKPRAPSLSERPSGRPRNFSLVGTSGGRLPLEEIKEELRERKSRGYDSYAASD